MAIFILSGVLIFIVSLLYLIIPQTSLNVVKNYLGYKIFNFLENYGIAKGNTIYTVNKWYSSPDRRLFRFVKIHHVDEHIFIHDLMSRKKTKVRSANYPKNCRLFEKHGDKLIISKYHHNYYHHVSDRYFVLRKVTFGTNYKTISEGYNKFV